MIDIRNVGKIFIKGNREVEVLKKINIHIQEGEFVSFMGDGVLAEVIFTANIDGMFSADMLGITGAQFLVSKYNKAPSDGQRIAEALIEIAGSQIPPHLAWATLRVEQNIVLLPQLKLGSATSMSSALMLESQFATDGREVKSCEESTGSVVSLLSIGNHLVVAPCLLGGRRGRSARRVIRITILLVSFISSSLSPASYPQPPLP